MRQTNFDLLRIISMLMVVSLHYLSKGGALTSFVDPFNGNSYLAYFLETLSAPAVNLFVLLSGYFLVKTTFKIEKMVSLIGQVLFYTVGVSFVLLVTEILPEYGFYDFVNDILPVQMEHYWFITAYLLLFAFTPLLNRALLYMNEKQLRAVILLFLVLFSLPKTILPITITIDHKGYDLIWFLCVYLIAGYIRLFGISFLENRKRLAILLPVTVFSGYLLTIAYGLCFRYTGKFEDQVLEVFQYNHLINLAMAVFVFYWFKNIEIKNKILQHWVPKISPYVLGVYLLHEQLGVRYLWPKWMQVENYASGPWFVIHYILTTCTIFIAGVLIDAVRHNMSKYLGGLSLIRPIKNTYQKVILKINQAIN